jgi:hypothetical protein
MTALNKWADLLIRREIAIDEIGRLTRPIPHGRDGAGDRAGSQLRPGLADFNKASESELAQLPGMTPTLAKGVVEHRPFKYSTITTTCSAVHRSGFDVARKLLRGRSMLPRHGFPRRGSGWPRRRR